MRRLGPMSCLPALLLGCSGEQAALAPRGAEAGEIGRLFWTTTTFTGVVLVGVCAATLLAIAGGDRVRNLLSARRFVIGAGLVFPIVSLLMLLAYGLSAMTSRISPRTSDAVVRATVVGEQWWWRVVYHLADGTRLETANELVIPVGEQVALTLESADVIHSFWVPSLAGKVDMIPGRSNRLVLQATQPGVSRGQCAEYCGGAHALMAFHVTARDRVGFDAWLEAQAEPAAVTEGEGAALFVRSGCGACHTIRGLESAVGTVGPDLTHVGSRPTLAAAALRNDPEAFASWIRDSRHVKPGSRMPPYRMLTDRELGVLAGYLDGLR
ncbi:cytochrome c oxidase subunit II [Reyranella sp.]|uniref:cytochrome c oxidase subunit II n=1 Tax=Reyranella sp. TaxID=1929291 RepID=UPI003BA8CDBE